MTDNARQHFKMKYQLAAMALRKPERFLATYGSPGSRYLAMLWDQLGLEQPIESRVPSLGLAATTLDVDGLSVSTVTFPPPAMRGDAYFLAVVPEEQQHRVFLLELALELDGTHYPALVEIKPDGRANWGAGPDPGLASFAEAVAALVRDPSRRPISFTRMSFT
jgi:hypothetical protein